MNTTSPSTIRSRTTPSLQRLAALLTLLLLLAGIAVYTWTLPGRKEKALRAASYPELVALAKREPNDSRVFYHMGLRLQSTGQLPRARIAFQHAGELDADDEDAWLAWAAVAGRLGNDQEAFAALTLLTKNHPKSARAHKALATFYYTQETLPRAYEEAVASARLNPGDAEAWRLAGVCALELETYSAAEEAFRKAVALDPRDWRALTGVGDALDKEERQREALDWYRKAHDAAPGQRAPTLAVGRVMFHMATTLADITAAREILEQADRQDPVFGHALIWLGRAYAREGQWDKARQALEHARTILPNASADAAGVAYELQHVYMHFGEDKKAEEEGKRHDALYTYSLEVYNLLARLHEAKGDMDRQLRLKLSRLYASHGDYAKSAREYTQLIRRAPDLPAAKQELAEVERKLAMTASGPPHGTAAAAAVPPTALLQEGEAMLAQQRYTEAQTTFLNAVRQAPQSANAVEGLGLALEGQGKSDETYTVLAHALKLDPTLPRAQYSVARMFFKSGLQEEAARRFEKLVRQVPNDPRYLHALGVCYLDTARLGQAEAMLARATALEPDNATYWLHLANAEVQNEKSTEAEAHYRRALQLKPSGPEAQVQLAKLLLTHAASTPRLLEAERLYRDALSAAPLNEEALLGLGSLQVQRQQPREAVTLLETLINHNSDAVQAYFQLAKAYDQLGKGDRASYCRKVFKTVSDFQTERDNTEEQVRLHLKDPALRLKLARLYAHGGQYPKALNQYQMCLRLAPGNPAAQKELDDLTARLKTSGQMASATTFNQMVRSSLNTK